MSALGERLNAIHQQLVEGGRTASLDLFREALDPIAGHVLRSVPGITEEDARDHAIAAIIGHVEKPASFDPAKSSLWTYLCLVATRDAIDALRQRGDRAELMEKHGYDIELWGARPNNDYDEIEWKKDAEKIMRQHGDYIVRNEGERRVLNLMLEGERELSAYAAALGLDQAGSATATEVKRVKDRINLRMKKVGNDL
jgi:DNA-directed RNA polymerase specialized sigma24 family protein